MNDYVDAGKRMAAAILAEALAMGDASFARAIWREAGAQLPKHTGGGRPPMPPEAPAEKGWHCRIMLFDERGELQADSMPDAAAEVTPDVYCNTLANAGAWAREVASIFHTEQREPLPVGLDDETLRRSIMSLRVSLSRNGGQTWWRIPYTVNGASWRVMMRVERATTE